MIDSISGRAAPRAIETKRVDKPAEKVESPTRTGATGPDYAAPARAELSALAAEARSAAAAPFDRARVEQLRAAIADGSYGVDPQAIARKMIALDLGAPEGDAK